MVNLWKFLFDVFGPGVRGLVLFRSGVVKQQQLMVEQYNMECKKMHGAHAEFNGEASSLRNHPPSILLPSTLCPFPSGLDTLPSTLRLRTLLPRS